MIEHDPELYHNDDKECFWVDNIEDGGHDKKWYRHFHWKFDREITSEDAATVFDVLDVHPQLAKFIQNFLEVSNGTS